MLVIFFQINCSQADYLKIQKKTTIFLRLMMGKNLKTKFLLISQTKIRIKDIAACHQKKQFSLKDLIEPEAIGWRNVYLKTVMLIGKMK